MENMENNFFHNKTSWFKSHSEEMWTSQWEIQKKLILWNHLTFTDQIITIEKFFKAILWLSAALKTWSWDTIIEFHALAKLHGCYINIAYIYNILLQGTVEYTSIVVNAFLVLVTKKNV